MVLLSENKDYQYLGISVPKYMETIEVGKEISPNRTKRIYWYGNNYKGCYDVPYNSVILGVIGNGSDITEEIARQIMEDGSNVTLDHLFTDKELLRGLIRSKGIQIENPYKKVQYHEWMCPSGHSYLEILRERERKWQDSESKTVKLVIIKVKK